MHLFILRRLLGNQVGSPSPPTVLETCWNPCGASGRPGDYFFVFPLHHPAPGGGCSNRVWEASSSCVGTIIWALQRSTLEADGFFLVFFPFSLACHYSVVVVPEDPSLVDSLSHVYCHKAIEYFEFVIKYIIF